MATPLLSLALLFAAAFAQQGQREGLRRVAPGFEDVSPIALSQRFEPVDNRATLFAEDVYEGERPGRFGSSERIYMRMYGGIVAVFPRGSYVNTPQGAAAAIPPGTVFHLGEPEDVLGESAAPAAMRPGQVNLRENLATTDGRSTGQPPRQQPAPGARTQQTEPAEPPSIFSSEPYRQRRMAALIADAARAELARR